MPEFPGASQMNRTPTSNIAVFERRASRRNTDKRETCNRVPRKFRWTRTGDCDPGANLFGSIADRRVVELGCGTGENLAALVAAGARGVGIDAAPAQIARARTRWTTPTFHATGAARYLATCSPAEIFYSIFGAVGLSPIPSLLAQIHDQLVPGGLLGIAVQLGAEHDDGTYPHRDPTDPSGGALQRYTPGPRAWVSLLGQAGFIRTQIVLADRACDPPTIVILTTAP